MVHRSAPVLVPRTVGPVLLLAAVTALAAPAAAQERVRFDIASFELPAGWTKTVHADRVDLRPADQPVTVTLRKSQPVQGTFAEHCQRILDEAARLPGHRLEAEPGTGWHRRSRGEWHQLVHSHDHPEQTGKFRYVAVLGVAAGGRYVAFTLTSDTAAAYEATRLAFGAMVDTVELTTTQRLERGTPPLTRFMVDEAVDFLEWLLHAPLTDEQRSTVESELRRFWREKIRDEIDGTVELLAARTELAALGEAERELARQVILEQALAGWRADADSPGAKMMLAIHAAANEPLAKGEPPLTRQAVEAFAEFLGFAAGQVAGCEGKLGKDVRDELARLVAEGYAAMGKDERETIAGMPMLWAALRVAWPDLAAEQKGAYVDGWRQSAVIAQLGAALKQQQQKAAEVAAAAESMRDMMRRQAMLQAQQMQFQVMQNVLRSQQDTMRIMSSNLGGNTTWVYRW